MNATPSTLTFRAAAEHVLAAAGTPLSVAVITERALTGGLLASGGRTPVASMGSQLATSVQQQAEESPFVRVAPATYALRRWIAEGKIAPPATDDGEGVRVPHYPTYSGLRALLPTLEGLARAQVTGMRAAIADQMGTTDDTVSWTEPDRWIPERLTGEHRDAALRIWAGTRRQVNPRYLVGHWLLASGYELVEDGPGGRLVVTPRGRDLVDRPDGATVREIDEKEGLLAILALLAEQGPIAPGALLAPWMAYLRRASRVRAETTGRSFLYSRLRNLLDRGYASRGSQRYEITTAGLAWLKSSGFAEIETAAPDETRQLWDLVQAQRDAVRQVYRGRLATMHPYAFEQLIGRLLEEMDYTDVEVTAPSGDKGVDVVGRIALGITEVREVIQVKRQQGNVQRPVLDMLRGSLHRFNAVKGTIISLGGFAKGTQSAAVEPGAAPITLIDGEKLLDLLIENGIGVRTKTVELLELDEGELSSVASDAGTPQN